jgi:hypothetical protein
LLSHQKKINAKFDHFIGALNKFSKSFDKSSSASTSAATSGAATSVAADIEFNNGGNGLNTGSDNGFNAGVEANYNVDADNGFNAGVNVGVNAGNFGANDIGVSAVGTTNLGGSASFEATEFTSGSASESVSGSASISSSGPESSFGGLSVSGSIGSNGNAQLDIGQQSQGYSAQTPVNQVDLYQPAPIAPIAPAQTYGPPGYTPPAVVEPQVILEVQQPPTIQRDYLPPNNRRRYKKL